MPFIQYEPRNFSDDNLGKIARANVIITEYQKQGFSLTVRQLYYQFVSRGFIPNSSKEYSKLQGLISDARMAGLMDWEAIVDRTRNLESLQHWTRPSQILESCADSYRIDRWDNQPHYLEVWVEKDALKGIVGQISSKYDVSFFGCRGYNSQSEMWAAGQRLLSQIDKGKQIHIIHLGDHDPSGVDMTRDTVDRLSLFTHQQIHVERIALTIDQVNQYDPPPNPAKLSDSRANDYIQRYGDNSWELDALEPSVMMQLIENAITKYIDQSLWSQAKDTELRGKKTLGCMVQYFPEIVKLIRQLRKQPESEVICHQCGATRSNPYCMCETPGNTRAIQLGEGT